MSNVTVQEALKNALFTIRCYRTEITLDKKRPNDLIEVDLVISEIDAALADIEKCEPVLKVHQGEICYKSQADDQSYGMWCPVNYDTEHFFKEGTEFYTSPQPRDWVGLTYKDKVDLRENNDWYNFPNDLIEATEAKCKQLNTKG